MAKSDQRLSSRELRRAGKSIGDIAQTVGVSKSSVSRWCIDIKLSAVQLEQLAESQNRGRYRGRMLGAATNRKKREKVIAFCDDWGKAEVGRMTTRDIFMVGIGLYMGEGRKGGNQFSFTNANPKIIKLLLLWLRKTLLIDNDRIRCRVYINKTHGHRVPDIEKAWSRIIGVHRNRFYRTVLINAVTKKKYENEDSYIGTLAIYVMKSSKLQYRVLGLMSGLLYNLKI